MHPLQSKCIVVPTAQAVAVVLVGEQDMMTAAACTFYVCYQYLRPEVADSPVSKLYMLDVCC